MCFSNYDLDIRHCDLTIINGIPLIKFDHVLKYKGYNPENQNNRQTDGRIDQTLYSDYFVALGFINCLKDIFFNSPYVIIIRNEKYWKQFVLVCRIRGLHGHILVSESDSYGKNKNLVTSFLSTNEKIQ